MTTKDNFQAAHLRDEVLTFLENKKAEGLSVIDIQNKTALADYMIVASGTSPRHIQTMGMLLKEHLRKFGVKSIGVEGKDSQDWVLIDAGDVIVHLFRPEVREFYDLERMWSVQFKDTGSDELR